MAVPYNDVIAGYLDGHTRIKKDGTWQIVEDIQVKHSGAWRDTKAVYVKSGGSWRTVHDGEHFLFSYYQYSDDASEFNLAAHISGLGYSGNLIKGAVQINAKRQRVHLGSFSSDSKVFLGVANYGSIKGRGGNGGNLGGGAQSAGTALYTRTGVFIENNGQMWGGGGGGRGGNNGQCVGTYYYNYNCGKNCYRQGTGYNYNPASGGGGGGGAGIPAGSGRQRGNNGSYNSGGNGGSGNGCGSNAGGKGGNPGQNASGGNSGSNGNSGNYIDGASYVYSWVSTGDRRGRSSG